MIVLAATTLVVKQLPLVGYYNPAVNCLKPSGKSNVRVCGSELQSSDRARLVTGGGFSSVTASARELARSMTNLAPHLLEEDLPKRHTRHSRRGFYPPKEDHSTLPGLLYVASETPEISDGDVAENGYSGASEIDVETGILDGDDMSLVSISKCENDKKSFPHSPVGKSVEKLFFGVANTGNLGTCSTLHTFCSNSVHPEKVIFFTYLELEAMFFLRFFNMILFGSAGMLHACAKLSENGGKIVRF